jgi:hypothetical protein
MSTPVIIGGFSAPDSELARKASFLVERVHSTALLHHVHRTWWFAEFLGQQRGLKYDREAVYLAALLHDLGLTYEFSADQRFEVDGADAASRFLLENGYPESKAELVWDAIALHSSAGIADRKQPEIALIYMGAHVDVMGLRLEEITPSLVEDTLALPPHWDESRVYPSGRRSGPEETSHGDWHRARGCRTSSRARVRLPECVRPD